MEGKAREAVLEIAIDELNNKDGVDILLAELDKLHLKDKFQLAYKPYDVFQKFKRPPHMSIGKYVAEFERLNNRAKA